MDHAVPEHSQITIDAHQQSRRIILPVPKGSLVIRGFKLFAILTLAYGIVLYTNITMDIVSSAEYSSIIFYIAICTIYAVGMSVLILSGYDLLKPLNPQILLLKNDSIVFDTGSMPYINPQKGTWSYMLKTLRSQRSVFECSDKQIETLKVETFDTYTYLTICHDAEPIIIGSGLNDLELSWLCKVLAEQYPNATSI